MRALLRSLGGPCRDGAGVMVRVAFALGLALLALVISGRSATASEAFHLTRLDHLALGPPETVTDVDIEAGFAYVGRGPEGLSIIDVSTPGAIQRVADFNLAGQLVVNDVAVAGGRAYLTNEGHNGVAVYILDVRVPAAPAVIGAIIAPVLNIAHNLFIDGDVLYVVGHEGVRGWRTRIFNVRDPLVPVLLAELTTPGAHDITVLDGVLYEGGGWGGLHLWDVRDPAHPVHLAAADTNEGQRPHYHAHSVWPSADRRHVLVMNEIESWWPGGIVAGGMRVFRWDGGERLELVATWRPDVAQGSPLTAIHNVVVHGQHAFISHYQAGVRVLDIADPEHPVEVGFFDTYPGEPRALFGGCWGIDLGSEAEPLIYASDRDRGLFQLRFDGARQADLAGSIISAAGGLPVPGAIIRLLSAGRMTVSDGAGRFQVATAEGSHRLEIRAPGYRPLILEVDLSPGPQPPLTIRLSPLHGTDVVEAPAVSPAPSLEASYPNPFRSSVAIPFVLGTQVVSPVSVRLTVHDLNGRCVRILLDGPASGGRQVVRWDGRDDRGRPVGTGVYFARLVVDGMTATRRLDRLR